MNQLVLADTMVRYSIPDNIFQLISNDRQVPHARPKAFKKLMFWQTATPQFQIAPPWQHKGRYTSLPLELIRICLCTNQLIKLNYFLFVHCDAPSADFICMKL